MFHRPRPGGDPLDRNPAEIAAKLRQDAVLERVERREIDMAALGLDHVIIVAPAKQRGDAEAGAGPDDADHAVARKRLVGPADVAEIVVGKRRDGISDRAEIVDHRIAVDVQPLLDQRGTDHPRIVGQLEHFAADRPGEGDGELVRKVVPARRPNSSQAGWKLACSAVLSVTGSPSETTRPLIDLGECETGMRSADVGDGDRPHACSASIAASIAEAPVSASSDMQPHQREQLASRAKRGRRRIGRRTRRQGQCPPLRVYQCCASRRTGSPSRSRASGPSGSASGETWIAAGTLPLAPDMRPSVISATR